MKDKTKALLEEILSSLSDLHFGVRDVRVCVFWSAVLSRTCGLASTVRPPFHEHEGGIRAVGRLTEMNALELARYCLSNNTLEVSIGLAALNSLIEVDEGACNEVNALELLLEKGRGKRVAVVGHFPFIEKLSKEVKELRVLERNPREGDLPEEKAGEVLPDSDVIAITGMSLINHSFFDILSLCPQKGFKVLVGPSSPMSSVLFEHGIDAIAGVRVVDPVAVLRTISQGAHFRAMEGVKRLTMIKQ